MNTLIKETKPGCLMCNGLYIKANGELPCWCDVGEKLILRTLDAMKLANGEEQDLFYFSALQHIRQSFWFGNVPYPDYCSRCAVYGHGLVELAPPTTIEVLHIEPSFFCNLACPQCLPPKQRRNFTTPPYNMSPEFYHNILKQLQREGVKSIRSVHFEGRGDPMMNNKLNHILAITKELYPKAFATITTNGNFPYRPWMIEGYIDSLRISADGVTQEAYVQYRKNGQLDRVIALIRDIRNHEKTLNRKLSIIWKYILFEWNDSDQDIRNMGQLAKQLNVDLQFCLTHSPGKSLRFKNAETLNQALRTLAPNAVSETTFQLKSINLARAKIGLAVRTLQDKLQPFLRPLTVLIPKTIQPIQHKQLNHALLLESTVNNAAMSIVIAQQVETLLSNALQFYRAGQFNEFQSYLIQALELDPGFKRTVLDNLHDTIQDSIDILVTKIRYPSTASLLANIQVSRGDFFNAGRLFERYLELAPHAEDATIIQNVIMKYKGYGLYNNALVAYRNGQNVMGNELLSAALSYDPGVPKEQLHGLKEPVKESINLLLETIHNPGTASLLANIQMFKGDFLNAAKLFNRYLELAPTAVDAKEIQDLIGNVLNVNRAA